MSQTRQRDDAPRERNEPGTRAWLHDFALVTRQATYDNFERVNSCILSTRIGVEVLGRFGLKARPRPVNVLVQNLDAYRLSEQRVPVEQWPDDAWSVGVAPGQAPRPGSWPGHLVIELREPDQPRVLIDLTADQFDRPERNLKVGGPVFMNLTGAWTPQDSLSTVIPDASGAPQTIVTYHPMPPGDPAFRTWNDAPDGKGDVTGFADEIERVLREHA
jgi:hypothetical protein